MFLFSCQLHIYVLTTTYIKRDCFLLFLSFPVSLSFFGVGRGRREGESDSQADSLLSTEPDFNSGVYLTILRS